MNTRELDKNKIISRNFKFQIFLLFLIDFVVVILSLINMHGIKSIGMNLKPGWVLKFETSNKNFLHF